MAPHHVEVRAHARERGAQLVSRVLNEPLLLLAGARQRSEHADRRPSSDGRPRRCRRRRRARPDCPVVPTCSAAAVSRRSGAGHAVGDPHADGVRRCRRRSTPAPACARASCAACVRSRRATAPPDRRRAEPDGPNPVVGAVDGDRVERLGAGDVPPTAAAASSRSALDDWRSNVDSPTDPSVANDLRLEPTQRTTAAELLELERTATWSWIDVGERAVDLGQQAVLGDAIAGDADHRAGDERQTRQRQRDLPAQAHRSSRATYPTPRTVWIETLAAAFLRLAAQVADVDRQVLGIRPEVVVPDPVVDRRVVEHDAGVAHQQLEKLVLGLAEVDVAIRRVTRRPPVSIARSPSRSTVIGAAPARRRRSACAATSARMRANSSARSNGFGR